MNHLMVYLKHLGSDILPAKIPGISSCLCTDLLAQVFFHKQQPQLLRQRFMILRWDEKACFTIFHQVG